MKTVIQELLALDETRGLKVKLADCDEPIDLIAETVQDSIEVVMEGKYPKPVSVYASLEKAKDRQKTDIDAYFGI